MMGKGDTTPGTWRKGDTDPPPTPPLEGRGELRKFCENKAHRLPSLQGEGRATEVLRKQGASSPLPSKGGESYGGSVKTRRTVSPPFKGRGWGWGL